VILIVGIMGYHFRQASLQAAVPGVSSTQVAGNSSSFGDLSIFKKITQDTLNLINTGNQSAATTRIGDLEYEWDTAQSRLKPRDKTKWNQIDGRIDTVLRELRAVNPNPVTEKAALQALLIVLNS
jgi:hypothetical protein